MKLKALVAAAFLALLAVSVAVAAPPPGKGKKPPTTGVGCKPTISVVLKGTLTADGAAAPFSLSVHVTGGQSHAKAYKAGTQPVSVAVTTSTKVRRGNSKSPTSLKSGDLVNIQARACKADLANSATPALTAVKITAHPAHSS
jgi:hypothetical protein